MRILKLVALMAAMGLILACNFPMFSPTTQPSSPTPTSAGVAPLDTATTLPPTFTAVPTITPTATIVPTPSVPQVSPVTAAVNCRTGPDVSYPAASSVALGQVAQIVGRNDDSSWWYVRDPYNTGSFCWVFAAVVTTAGNLAGLPVIAPPAVRRDQGHGKCRRGFAGGVRRAQCDHVQRPGHHQRRDEGPGPMGNHRRQAQYHSLASHEFQRRRNEKRSRPGRLLYRLWPLHHHFACDQPQ